MNSDTINNCGCDLYAINLKLCMQVEDTYSYRLSKKNLVVKILAKIN